MGLMEQEITELRELRARLASGSITPGMVAAEISIYSQVEKRSRMILQAHTLSARQGPSALAAMEAANLLGGGAQIGLGEPPFVVTPAVEE